MKSIWHLQVINIRGWRHKNLRRRPILYRHLGNLPLCTPSSQTIHRRLQWPRPPRHATPQDRLRISTVMSMECADAQTIRVPIRRWCGATSGSGSAGSVRTKTRSEQRLFAYACYWFDYHQIELPSKTHQLIKNRSSFSRSRADASTQKYFRIIVKTTLPTYLQCSI